MKNKEKQGKDITELALAGKGIALDIRTMKVCGCDDISCDYCRFNEENYPYKQGNCGKNCIHWANSEYSEAKVFTKQEKKLLELCNKIKWVAKDKDGEVYFYSEKPYRENVDCFWHATAGIEIRVNDIASCKFESIKWEDDEPTHRNVILQKGGNK